METYSYRRYVKAVHHVQVGWEILYHTIYNCTNGIDVCLWDKSIGHVIVTIFVSHLEDYLVKHHSHILWIDSYIHGIVVMLWLCRFTIFLRILVYSSCKEKKSKKSLILISSVEWIEHQKSTQIVGDTSSFIPINF